jgi:hypothetical protein
MLPKIGKFFWLNKNTGKGRGREGLGDKDGLLS